MTNNINDFIMRWKDRGDELSDTQTFWLELLGCLSDTQNPGEMIEFQKRVELSHVSFIDGYIPSTRIIIEQKSRSIDLDKPQTQSDGTVITPFGQAKRYYDWLPASQRGRFIVVCNFREFRVHDMETPRAEPEIILLENLGREANKLAFLVDSKASSPKEIRELEVSVKAGELVGKLYDSLLTRYVDPDGKASQRSLNIFCVRVVFLLYAEDSGLFAPKQFHDYLASRRNSARNSLRELFAVLSRKPENRDPYLEADLQAFPYVNGGLFEEADIEIPQLDGEPLRIILEEMSEGFNWAGISPTIFGAVFESTLNPKTRHSGGMHYTSIENIHKVIDPLFMDGLNAEFEEITSAPPDKSRTQNLRKFQKKLGTLRFFDPACGSGNFLTETYLSLRRLENRIIQELTRGQISFAFSQEETPVQVSISQFYGIEINDFAVHVARTALWIAETQMFNETKSIVQLYEDILPLKTYNRIIEANSVLTDWREVITPDENLCVIGNPPYLGYPSQSKEQKQEIASLYKDGKLAGKLDYVACWYYKASEFLCGTKARAAFVSTNSITQGELVSTVFKPLHFGFRIFIDFAHTAFKWDSEAEEKAQVHCVVIGFSWGEKPGVKKKLITGGKVRLVDNINFYLVPGPNEFAEPQPEPMREDTPRTLIGGLPRDDGNLLMTAEERDELLRTDPLAEKLIRPFMMGVDFIQRVPRYCLWLVDASPSIITKCPRVMERIERVKQFRLESARAATRKQAETPALFSEIRYATKNYLAIPQVSSDKRSYIPFGWLPAEVIPGNTLYMIPDATLYHFGVLTSRVHMAWVRRVCGRLGIGYRYSTRVVYNTFCWPSPTKKQRARIERTAQAILDARALNPECSFAELYTDNAMPLALREAHRANDAAVCAAYGWAKDRSEEDIAAELFRMYREAKKDKS
ncbi:MAG: class I SAM-dependent DNA methyltransferase [Synergistaceae bacterium]|nr:class I SAM-dependent DNA methyltransferase [Synergistaceae bacterium]